MKKLVIVGCGRLADIVADAVVNGLLPEYDLTGVYSRTASKAERIVNKNGKTRENMPCMRHIGRFVGTETGLSGRVGFSCGHERARLAGTKERYFHYYSVYRVP